MRSFLRVAVLAVVAAAFHFVVMTTFMLAGIGPMGRAVRLLASGGMSAYDEATSRAWFQAAEHSVMLDRFVLWPATFLLASIFGVRLVPQSRWWHSFVLACAVLPLSFPSAVELAGFHIPGSSRLSPWIGLVAEVFSYTLFVAVVSYLLRRRTLRQQAAAA